MSQDVIESKGENESETVRIGENLPISMKLVQSIYNEITGKTEKLSRSFRDDHEINFEDINQLNTKITQLYEQYHVISKNCAVTIYHIDDCSEQFSSFERFKMYDSSSMSPCENIRLAYDFLVKLPGTQKVQSYKIEIDIHSRAAMRKRAFREHGLPRRIIRVFASRTANVDIEYIDYTVARTFLFAIEQWYASVNKNKSSWVMKKLQDFSSHLPFAFKVVTSIVVLASFYRNKDILLTQAPSLSSLFSACLAAFGAVYVSGLVVAVLGRFCEEAFDSHQAVSSLDLNRGDKASINEFKENNSKSILLIILSTGAAIAVNVFSSYLSSILGLGT
jgi:hypothetical protein